MRLRCLATRLLSLSLPLISSMIPAQQPVSASLAADAPVAVELPDAPSALQQPTGQGQAQDHNAPPPVSAGLQGPFGPLPPAFTSAPLTSRQRFTIYIHETYGPPAVLLPAFGAAMRMARPPNNYPRDWRDGAEAFGRLYGSSVATQTAQHTAKFMTEVLLHEDPRYLSAPQGSTIGRRVFHAVGFAIVDRDNSGHRRLAYSNFAGAAAGGFVGMAYLPDGYNDLIHAGQRTGTQFIGIGVSNIAREFAPELAPLIRKIHFPQVVPPWWVPDHSHGPSPWNAPNHP